MASEKQTKPERIDVKLPYVPRSFRGFIDKIIHDDRAFQTVVESPLEALAAAGVTIRRESFTAKDHLRLIKVLANIRNYVKQGKFGKDIRFEELFNAGGDVTFATKEKETYAVQDQDWQNDQSADVDKGSTEGVSEHFEKDYGIRPDESIRTIPLLTPSDLSDILSRIDVAIAEKRM
jgi:hypothetical protein